MTAVDLVAWTVVICFVYLIGVYGWSVVLLMASLAEHLYRMWQPRRADDLTDETRFVIPVSVLSPVHNEGSCIIATVRSLLALDYPMHEVVVVNDGSTDDTLERMQSAFALEPRAVFYRRQIATEPVRCVYVSREHRNLIVIDKENGGKADALNCALNVARYRYICTVDGDTFYHVDALRKAMRPVRDDPGLVVGVSSAIAIHRHPEELDLSAARTQRLDRHLLTSFQLLDFFRSFLNTRLGSTHWGFMLCASGAFALWRRELVLQLGGFSSDFTCEDIEFTFRVHEHLRRTRTPYRVVSLGTLAGTTESPPRVRDLVAQRARWQRVILETVWAYRRMCVNRRYGSVGMVGVPHYVLTEVVAPVMQVLAVTTALWAWWLGVLDLRLLQLLLIVALANGILANASILLQDGQSRSYPLRDLVRLVCLGPLELILSRPIIIVAQLKGFADFLRGEKGWDKFERHTNGASA
jgi:biofilm PGA synthesis N-glycosyltransferase PgaC